MIADLRYCDPSTCFHNPRSCTLSLSRPGADPPSHHPHHHYPRHLRPLDPWPPCPRRSTSSRMALQLLCQPLARRYWRPVCMSTSRHSFPHPRPVSLRRRRCRWPPPCHQACATPPTRQRPLRTPGRTCPTRPRKTPSCLPSSLPCRSPLSRPRRPRSARQTSRMPDAAPAIMAGATGTSMLIPTPLTHLLRPSRRALSRVRNPVCAA